MKSEVTIEQALKFLNSNKPLEARKILDNLLSENPKNIQAKQLLVKYAFSQKNYQLAEKNLHDLIEIKPLNDNYINSLVSLYGHQKRWIDIAALYLQLTEIQPSNATMYFNSAYYFKIAGEFSKAIQYYNKAMALGISQDYEVSLNLASIYSEHLSNTEKAIDILATAIKKHPDQDSLLYNLANIYEQLGNKEKAFTLFKKAFSENPQNYNALARQVDIYKISAKDGVLITQVKSALKLNHMDSSNKINLAYALGKAYDDCSDYPLAFKYYQQANQLDQKTLPSYTPKAHEHYINNIIKTFSKSWYEKFVPPKADVFNTPPAFICGMFRSGSTLCEQILASHSQISIGGEQEFFHRTITNSYANYPNINAEELNENKNELLNAYKTEIQKQANNGKQLTDKRPDNFLYLGLIKALMPTAKIIWSKRAMLDNCLSVYFLRLGASMSYSTELENIVHFYKQQEKLMSHWQSLFGDSLYEFNYDDLIESPEKNIKQLLSFLELPWESDCLDFYKIENQVKTASVWQVRQPLYNRSSGRWKNYQQFLKHLNKE